MVFGGIDPGHSVAAREGRLPEPNDATASAHQYFRGDGRMASLMPTGFAVPPRGSFEPVHSNRGASRAGPRPAVRAAQEHHNAD